MICDKIRQLRKDSMLTQMDAAEKLHGSLSWYRAIESGEQEPSYDALRKIAKLYKVSFFELTREMDSQISIPVQLEPGAKLPAKAHAADAGFDLFSMEHGYVPGLGSAVFDTGVHMAIPEGYCGVLISKSGLNIKHDITSDGLIDSGYTGTIKVKLYSSNRNGYYVQKHDKISQLVILPLPNVQLEQVDEIATDTERGDNGFGSSGR